jgi:hypothetical protein
MLCCLQWVDWPWSVVTIQSAASGATTFSSMVSCSHLIASRPGPYHTMVRPSVRPSVGRSLGRDESNSFDSTPSDHPDLTRQKLPAAAADLTNRPALILFSLSIALSPFLSLILTMTHIRFWLKQKAYAEFTLIKKSQLIHCKISILHPFKWAPSYMSCRYRAYNQTARELIWSSWG